MCNKFTADSGCSGVLVYKIDTNMYLDLARRFVNGSIIGARNKNVTQLRRLFQNRVEILDIVRSWTLVLVLRLPLSLCV